jgi:DNA-directed RNA polymerase subunit RPC12/RpoP
LAEMLGNLSEQDRQRVIALAELATDAPDKHRDSPEDMPRCPHCSGVHVRRNGFVRGRQRYLCGDCGRTFGATTGSVRYKSKHGKETWEAPGGIRPEASPAGGRTQVRHSAEHLVLLAAQDPRCTGGGIHGELAQRPGTGGRDVHPGQLQRQLRCGKQLGNQGEAASGLSLFVVGSST